MTIAQRPTFRVAPQYQPLMRAIGLDAETVFTHPDVRVWRVLADRENATLDADLRDTDLAHFGDAGRVRLHLKRYAPAVNGRNPADEEAKGYDLLQRHDIPTAPLVGWGALSDGRSFLLTEDLYGHAPADKLVESGEPFEPLLAPTADLAARLHDAGLHHRDLYLCHFMARRGGTDAEQSADAKLIDVARVKPLPGWFRQRWIVKDLAQFWFSTLSLPTVTDAHRTAWLDRYAGSRGLDRTGELRAAIERKVRWIIRHDERLRREQPTRNISIPD